MLKLTAPTCNRGAVEFLFSNRNHVIRITTREIATTVLASLMLISNGRAEEVQALNMQTDGYRGIWYQRQKSEGDYRYKYSGGLGTYSAKHQPFAIYSPAINRTYFCYGGAPEEYHRKFNLDRDNLDPVKTESALYHLVSYFDHDKGTLPRPTILLDKHTHDAHDNPVISVDAKGYVWVFSTAHGSLRPAHVHRSNIPHDISAFTHIEPYHTVGNKKIPIANFSYMQAWNVPEKGFVFFFTKYEKWRRDTCFATSVDGIRWTNWKQLAGIEEGHYQVSVVTAGKAACALNYHPRAFHGNDKRRGLNWRTNLYYMETLDFGKTWRAADGTALEVPLTDPHSPALVRDFELEEKLVYLKDIIHDGQGHPIILFVTSRGYEPGPESGPRVWHIARWSGQAWGMYDIASSDSNYDMGSLYADADGTLRVIAPTETGPQPGNPGGEIAIWVSEDSGKSWHKHRQLTSHSDYNHTYVRRPVKAHPDFYGYWTDGNGRKPSPSRLYFCNRKGDVFQMPTKMEKEQYVPIRVSGKVQRFDSRCGFVSGAKLVRSARLKNLEGASRDRVTLLSRSIRSASFRQILDKVDWLLK